MFRGIHYAALAVIAFWCACVPVYAQTIWNTPVNAVAGENSLTKSGGCDGCYDAGASTQASVSSGDAYVDFQFGDPNGLARAGFAHAFNPNAGTSQDFALRVQGGVAEVRERGIYRTDIGFGPGTTFRVAVQSGVVTYAKNGVVFYTSSDPVQYPFVFGVILGNANTSVNSVAFTASTPSGGGGSSGGGSGGSSGGGSTGGGTTGGGTGGGSTGGTAPITWTSANVTFDGASVSKSSGCDGCFDAFVKSAETVGSTGYVEFAVSDTAPYLLGGLTKLFTQGDGTSIDYGIRVQGGYAEVRENGVYRSDIAAPAGSVFRISISGGVVTYSRDGFVFYSGPVAAGPFSFATLFANLHASISDVVISNGP